MNTKRNIMLLSIMLAAGCASTATKPLESVARTEETLNSPESEALRQEYPTLFEDAEDALRDANTAHAHGQDEEAELYSTIAKAKIESARNLSLANEYKAKRAAMANAAHLASGRLDTVKQENAVVKRYQELDKQFNDATAQLERYKGEDQEARKTLAKARKLQGDAINEGAADKAPKEYNDGQTYIESSLKKLEEGDTKGALELAKRSEDSFNNAITNAKKAPVEQPVKEEQTPETTSTTDNSDKSTKVQIVNVAPTAEKSSDDTDKDDDKDDAPAVVVVNKDSDKTPAPVAQQQVAPDKAGNTTVIVNADGSGKKAAAADNEKIVVIQGKDAKSGKKEPGYFVAENHITVDMKKDHSTEKQPTSIVVQVPKSEKEKDRETASSLSVAVPPPAEAPKIGAPTYQKPEYQAPSYQKPDYEAPSYQKPVYQAPVYEKPEYQAPTYKEPVYQPPTYQPPEYKAPKYEAPTYPAVKSEAGSPQQPIIITPPAAPQQPASQPIIITPPAAPAAAPQQPFVIPVPQPIVIQAPAAPAPPAPVVYPPYPPQPAYPPQPPVIIQAPPPAPAPAPAPAAPVVLPIPIPQGGSSQPVVIPVPQGSPQPIVIPQAAAQAAPTAYPGIAGGAFQAASLQVAGNSGTRDRVLSRMSDVQLKRAELLGRGDESMCPDEFNEFDAILQIAEKRFDSGDYLLALEYLTRAEERLNKCKAAIEKGGSLNAPAQQSLSVNGLTQEVPQKQMSTKQLLGLNKFAAAERQQQQLLLQQQQQAQMAAPVQPVAQAPQPQPAAPVAAPQAQAQPQADDDLPKERPAMAPIDALYVPDDDDELPPPLVNGDYLTQTVRREAIKAITNADRFVARSVRRRKTNRTRLRAAIMMLQRARSEYYREDYISATITADKAKRIVATQAQLSSLPEALIGPALPPAINPLENIPAPPTPTVPATVNPNPPSPFLLPRDGAASVAAGLKPGEEVAISETTVIVDPATEQCKGNAALIDIVNRKQREVATPKNVQELIKAANDLNKANQCKEAVTFYQQALSGLYAAGAKPEPVGGANSEDLKNQATVALGDAEQKKAANSKFGEDPSYQVGVRLLSNANDSFRKGDYQNALILAKQAAGSFDGVDKSGKPPKDIDPNSPEAIQYPTEYGHIIEAIVARDRAHDRLGGKSDTAFDRALDYLAKARRAWDSKDFLAADKFAVESKKDFDSVQKPTPKPDNSAQLAAEKAKADAAKKLQDQKRDALDALEKARQARRDCDAQSCRARDERAYLDAVGKVVDAETAIATEQYDKTISAAQDAINKFKAILAQPAPVEPDSPYLSLSGDQLMLRPRITFDSGANSITADAVPAIDAAADFFKKFSNRILSITIAGYTDSRGNAGRNQRLSADRAEAVEQALKARGVNIKITAVGYGENNPIASNKTADGREKNRRVEIRFKTQD